MSTIIWSLISDIDIGLFISVKSKVRPESNNIALRKIIYTIFFTRNRLEYPNRCIVFVDRNFVGKVSLSHVAQFAEISNPKPDVLNFK